MHSLRVGRKLVKRTARNIAIGKRVQLERESQRISRALLAAHLEIDESVMGRIETGHVALSLVRAEQIARYLSVPLSRLLAEVSDAERRAV